MLVVKVKAVVEPSPAKVFLAKVEELPAPPPAIAPHESVKPSKPPVVLLYLKYPAAPVGL
jgi:hypothetical protein